MIEKVHIFRGAPTLLRLGGIARRVIGHHLQALGVGHLLTQQVVGGGRIELPGQQAPAQALPQHLANAARYRVRRRQAAARAVGLAERRIGQHAQQAQVVGVQRAEGFIPRQQRAVGAQRLHLQHMVLVGQQPHPQARRRRPGAEPEAGRRARPPLQVRVRQVGACLGKIADLHPPEARRLTLSAGLRQIGTASNGLAWPQRRLFSGDLQGGEGEHEDFTLGQSCVPGVTPLIVPIQRQHHRADVAIRHPGKALCVQGAEVSLPLPVIQHIRQTRVGCAIAMLIH